jgi:hypothetical protein
MECISCKNLLENNLECTNCGAFIRINPQNATVEWIKDGRVLKNETMEREAWELWKKIYPDSFE